MHDKHNVMEGTDSASGSLIIACQQGIGSWAGMVSFLGGTHDLPLDCVLLPSDEIRLGRGGWRVAVDEYGRACSVSNNLPIDS